MMKEIKIYLTRRTSRPNHWYYLTDVTNPNSVQPINLGESIEANNDEIRVDDLGMYVTRIYIVKECGCDIHDNCSIHNKDVTKHICCNGECLHDSCCGKVPANCPTNAQRTGDEGRVKDITTATNHVLKKYDETFKELKDK